MNLRIIITGATGMVGEGVLLECLRDPAVEAVLLLSRKPSGYAHPKLRELLHADFQHLAAVETQLTGYNACFYCAGVSSLGISQAEYERVTYDTTLAVAQTLLRLNPDLVFCYVTGAGTDSSERGRSHWARTKGRAENALLRLPFRARYVSARLHARHVWPAQRAQYVQIRELALSRLSKIDHQIRFHHGGGRGCHAHCGEERLPQTRTGSARHCGTGGR